MELDSETITPEPVLTEPNRASHLIVAHLQCYVSELKSLRSIVTELSADYGSLYKSRNSEGVPDYLEQAIRSFSQILSQVEAIHEFAVKLEKKTQNILALVSYRRPFMRFVSCPSLQPVKHMATTVWVIL